MIRKLFYKYVVFIALFVIAIPSLVSAVSLANGKITFDIPNELELRDENIANL